MPFSPSSATYPDHDTRSVRGELRLALLDESLTEVRIDWAQAVVILSPHKSAKPKAEVLAALGDREVLYRNLAIRAAAIVHCRLLSLRWGDAVPASELSRGFIVDGERIHLVAWGRGVFKPKQLTDGPLTLRCDEHCELGGLVVDELTIATDSQVGSNNDGRRGYRCDY